MKCIIASLAMSVFCTPAGAYEVKPYQTLCFTTFAEFNKSRLEQYPGSKLTYAALQGEKGQKVFGAWTDEKGGWFITSQADADNICVLAGGTDWKAAE